MALGGLKYAAQVAINASSGSASQLAAEMTKGRLSPVDSRPGDAVVVTLRNDLRSNGQVVMKSGTSITGVVRNVKHGETNSLASIIEIEWFAPAAQGKAAQNLAITLQSVVQLNPNPISRNEQRKTAADQLNFTGGALTTAVARPEPPKGRASGSRRWNTALMSMPSVAVVDEQTTSAIESSLGVSSSQQLFKVGRGKLLTAGGSEQSLDIFSHLDNDTVITSASKDFEVSGGAQMQLLVGVNKK